MKTAIGLVIDESGSMAGQEATIMQGYRTFIEGQRRLPGDDPLYAKVQFRNGGVTKPLVERLSAAPATIDYAPNGGTPLLDAVGELMETLGSAIQGQGIDKVIVVIMTDGEENASRRFDHAKIKGMIEHAQQHGWEFIYMGASLSAFNQGLSMGINLKNVVHTANDQLGNRAAYAAVSASTASLRVGGQALVQESYASYDPRQHPFKPKPAPAADSTGTAVVAPWVKPLTPQAKP